MGWGTTIFIILLLGYRVLKAHNRFVEKRELEEFERELERSRRDRRPPSSR
jgi:hypothetical protein